MTEVAAAATEGLVGRRSIVLVEDDPGDTLLVTEMLADVAPDAGLTCFRTLRAALEAWPADADCALLDLGLPDALGLSALERLRSEVPDVPVVVLTGDFDHEIGPMALAAGAQDFLVKGQVDARGLERSLRYAVERGRATAYERDLVAADLRAQENTRLQRGLLPNPLLDAEQLGLALHYRPGSERDLLGGDFYDVVQTPVGIHVLIGDVSGHGIEEAALGVALRIAWRTLVLAGLPVADVLRGMEKVLFAERTDDERFATVAMISLPPSRDRLEVVLCGHPFPLLVRGSDVIELRSESLPMLTMLDGHEIVPNIVDVDGDWGLVLYTDGLVEGATERGSSDRLGADGLARILRDALVEDLPRNQLAPRLLAEAERRNGGPLTDDVAVLLAGSLGWWG